MSTLNHITDVVDLNKLTSSPMKIPMGVPTIGSYHKKNDIVTPCIHHHPKIVPTTNRYQQQLHHHYQKNTITPQRLNSTSSSSTTTPPTRTFMATKDVSNSRKLSQRHHCRQILSFLTKPVSFSTTTTTTTTPPPLEIKEQESKTRTTWNVFKKRSNRSPPSSPQQRHQKHSIHTSNGGNGVFISADKPFVPGTCTCTCTDPTTLKMNRAKKSYDSSTMTTTTSTIATTTVKNEQQQQQPSSGRFRTLPTTLSSNDHQQNISNNQKKKKNVYDPSQWPCALVQDTIEQDRLVAQHYLLRIAFNGDHHAPVQSLLSQRQQHPSLFGSNKAATTTTACGDGIPTTTSASSSLYSDNNNNKVDSGPVVLDVGCGLGQWSMEMATAYPKSTFIGIDILPTFPKDIKPRNCHFLQANVKQLPLPFTDNSIDFIYQRDLNWGLGQDDWYPLIKEYLRILKPGGWIELVEADLETKSSLEKECAMNDKLLEGFSKRRQDPYVARRLPTMLAVHGFRRVESHFQSLPLGWKNYHVTEQGNDNNHLHYHPMTTNDIYGGGFCTPERQVQAMASQYLFYLRSLGPWLRLVMGLSQTKYVDYVDQLPLEWEKAQTYVNWHCATAQKPYE